MNEEHEWRGESEVYSIQGHFVRHKWPGIELDPSLCVTLNCGTVYLKVLFRTSSDFYYRRWYEGEVVPGKN
jgi:hypothetical protein